MSLLRTLGKSLRKLADNACIMWHRKSEGSLNFANFPVNCRRSGKARQETVSLPTAPRTKQSKNTFPRGTSCRLSPSNRAVLRDLVATAKLGAVRDRPFQCNIGGAIRPRLRRQNPDCSRYWRIGLRRNRAAPAGPPRRAADQCPARRAQSAPGAAAPRRWQ